MRTQFDLNRSIFNPNGGRAVGRISSSPARLTDRLAGRRLTQPGRVELTISGAR